MVPSFRWRHTSRRAVRAMAKRGALPGAGHVATMADASPFPGPSWYDGFRKAAYRTWRSDHGGT